MSPAPLQRIYNILIRMVLFFNQHTVHSRLVLIHSRNTTRGSKNVDECSSHVYEFYFFKRFSVGSSPSSYSVGCPKRVHIVGKTLDFNSRSARHFKKSPLHRKYDIILLYLYENSMHGEKVLKGISVIGIR